MTSQLVVGPHSSSSLIRSNSVLTVDKIITNGLDIGSTIGVTGDLNITNEYQINGNTVLTGITLGSGVTSSNLQKLGDLNSLNIIGDLTVDTNTLYVDSTNNNVGINTVPNSSYSLDVVGDTNINGGVTITGDLNVVGGVTSFFTTTSTINETFLKLAITNPNDLVDTGVYNMYQQGGITKFAGYFRDSTDKVFKFFEGTTLEPNSNIDTNNGGYQLADIQVDNISSNTLNVSTTGIFNDLSITNNVLVDNKLGINLNPVYQLDVSGDINTTNNYKIDGVEVLNNNILGNGVTSSNLQELGNLNSLIIINDLIVDNNTLFVQSSSNRVGIGTTPSFSLDVTGDINNNSDYKIDGIEVLNSNTLGNGVTSSNLQKLGILNFLNVNGNGIFDNIGVGTTPLYKLHIFENNALANRQLYFENPSGPVGISMENNTSNFSLDLNSNGLFLTNITGNNHYETETGDHKFYTNTTEKLIITNLGNVGIGVTNPSYLLDVTGDINSNNSYYLNEEKIISNNGITSNQFIFKNRSFLNQDNTTGSININISGIKYFEFQGITNNFNVYDGNIGINVSQPQYDLTFGITSVGINYTALNTLGFFTNNIEVLTINGDRNVGIRNPTPNFPLDVFGDINFSGNLRQNGALFLNPDGIWTQNDGSIFNNNTLNVGIGITDPESKLHIIVDSNSSNSIGSTHGIRINTGSNGESLYMGYDGTNNHSYINSGTSSGSSDLILNINGGNVGIGITNPTTTLEINGDVNINTRIDNASDNQGTLIINQYSDEIDNIVIRRNDNNYIGGLGWQNSGGFLASYIGWNGSLSTLNFHTNTALDNTTNNFNDIPIRMTIDSSGNINMDGNLTVNNDLTIDTNTFYVDSTTDNVCFGTTDTTSIFGNKTIKFNNDSTQGVILQLTNQNSTSTGALLLLTDDALGLELTNNTTNGYVSFLTQSIRRMYIGSTGNIGIGTENPLHRLHIKVNDMSESNPGLLLESVDTFGHDSVLELRGARISSTTNDIAQLVFSNYDNDLTDTNIMGKITGKVNNATTNVGDLIFYTYSDGNTASETMILKSNGNVGIGGINPSFQLQLSTDSAAKPTTNTWTISSDIRLKENIEIADYNTCYNNIKLLDLKYFKWKDKYIQKHKIKDHKRIGWIADDVEKIFPKSVEIQETNEYNDIGITNDLKTLNTDIIYSSMYGCIKKLIIDKEKLEEENINLKKNITNILNRLSIIEDLYK